MPEEPEPPAPLLDVVYADDDIAVVDKPAELLSCPGRDPSLSDSVQTRAPRVFAGAHGPILAHRLDQPTSGLMVLGLTPDAHRALRRQFEARTVTKAYVAVVVGDVSDDAGVIELPFRLDIDNRPHQIYDPVHGKVGVTRYEVIERRDGQTSVRFFPHTGRTHQLRVHAAHPLGLGCPIAGDRLYGDAASAPRLLLHAEQLAFEHPRLGDRRAFVRAAPFSIGGHAPSLS